MALLPFISDSLLVTFAKEVLDKATAAEVAAEDKLYSNVIDPFSALFEAMRHNLTLDEWLLQEKSRQIQKTLQNAVGDFHQNVLGSIAGWENAGRGGSYDIKNSEKKIIAEIKNKHNTMNSSSAEAVYNKLSNHIRYNEKGYTAYVVFIIPNRPEPMNSPWSPNRTTMTLRDDIRRIDGASFYALATNYPDALALLYTALPQVLGMAMHSTPDLIKNSNLFASLFTRAYDVQG